MRILWTISGLIAVALGAIGVVLPILPTVPFLLLATFCLTRSSEKLNNWLLSHPTFGPPIKDWKKSGAIKRKTKGLATLSVILAFVMSLFLQIKPIILFIQLLVLITVMLFIWTRPEK